MTEKIEKISKIVENESEIKTPKVAREPNRDYFDELMRQRSVKTEVAEQMKIEGQKLSLMDEVRNLNQKTTELTRATPLELSRQADDVIAQIDTLKHKLETPDLTIKDSMQTVLKTKLDHIDESLKTALSKANLEYTPAEVQKAKLTNPIERFLGLLTHGQEQLQTLTKDIQFMADKPNGYTPADMLLIQVKVTHVQQEIELFTSMLNKALESTKTIMNVQV